MEEHEETLNELKDKQLPLHTDYFILLQQQKLTQKCMMHLYSGTFSKGSALDFKVHFLRIIDFQGHVLGRQQGE